LTVYYTVANKSDLCLNRGYNLTLPALSDAILFVWSLADNFKLT